VLAARGRSNQGDDGVAAAPISPAFAQMSRRVRCRNKAPDVVERDDDGGKNRSVTQGPTMNESAQTVQPPGMQAAQIDLPKRKVEVEVAALSDTGSVRPANEDSFVVFRLGRFLEPLATSIPEREMPPRTEEHGHVMIVADGVGGLEAGALASRTTLLTALRFILHSPKWALNFNDPATRKHEIDLLAVRARGYLAAAQAEIRRQVEQNPGCAGMGSTFTGVYVVGYDAFVLHIGDSKAFVLRNGALQKITRDHTMAQQIADMGVIRQEDVAKHELQHVLTRAVGAYDAEADFQHFELRDGDRLLLCSDGLTDMVDELTIASLMSTAPASDDACSALISAALEAGGRDNVTVIVAGLRSAQGESVTDL
jgi:serine/threonine protein phosphatase PrpC